MNVYDTGWVACNDWTNQHLGDAVGGNVNHGLDAPLSELIVKALISTDGTDANSFEAMDFMADAAVANYGYQVLAVDNDNIKVQTGNGGLLQAADATGFAVVIDTEAWYYKIKVYKP